MTYSKYSIIYLFSLLGYSSFCFAQPILDFNESIHSFGDIIEGAEAKHTFDFINSGNETLLISSVKASCGCTTPNWTKEPIAPGAKGSITAIYNSKNRPGTFNKSITIISNAQQQLNKLYIKGNVMRESEVKTYNADELTRSPIIAISKDSIHIGKAEVGQQIFFELEISNTGSQALSIKETRAPCNCVSIATESPKIIASGQSKVVKFVYSPRVAGDFDQPIRIFSNDITQKAKTLNLTSKVVEKIAKENMLQEHKNRIKF